MSELANRILQGLIANYHIGWKVAEGRIIHDIKQHDPTISQLYRFPHEFDAALLELAAAKMIEKHPIFPDWKMLKFPKEKPMMEAVTVVFKMRREHKAEHLEGKRQFWIQVTATPQSLDIHEVKIDMYQVSRECYSPYGLGLTPYSLNSGESSTWDIEKGDIVLIIVRYTEQSDTSTWKMAAQGVWMCDGYRFQSGKTLKDSSDLFA